MTKVKITDVAVQVAAKKDAEIAGRTFSCFSKHEKQRFLDRAKYMLTAAFPHLQPVDVAAVRRQAFEEVCTELEINWPHIATPEMRDAIRALSAEPAQGKRKYKIGDRLTKTKGSKWTGHVVGFYSTALTPVGYAIESETETGSVQIYPETALTAAPTSESGR